ncbi:MAG: LolA-like putative outer membrane lipoprotein chaperone, partial [Bacteroidia bacterium]|nr:LolA-like putative outer membrane lipoprotein chaperone [Bacteroidia bacterium]
SPVISHPTHYFKPLTHFPVYLLTTPILKKKIMKRKIFTFAALLVTTLSFAQSSANAKSILDKAYGIYENSKGIKISFNMTATDENNTTNQVQKGTALVKDNKFKIEMSTIDIWFDGKTQWMLMKDLNEVNISNPSPEEITSISPLALLSIYKTGYILKNPVTKTINKKSVSVIDMVPTSSKSDFKNVSVAIDKKSNTILQVNLTMKNGMKNKIDINDYNANYNFADSEFVFDKANHKGVEMIDLR